MRIFGTPTIITGQTNPVTIPVPTEAAAKPPAGHIMIALITSDAVGSVPTQASWTAITLTTQSANMSYHAYKRLSDGAEPDNYAFTVPGNGGEIGRMIVLDPEGEEVDLDDVLVHATVPLTIDDAGSNASQNAPTISVPANHIAKLFAHFIVDSVRTVTTPPDGMTLISVQNGAGYSDALYEQSVTAGDHTKGITWSSGEQLVAFSFAVIAPVASATAAITGTAATGTDESHIVAGGRTIIITLTDDTFVAAGGTFDAQRQAIINGLVSAQAEATGWNAEVRDNLAVTAVVRTSDTVVTITLSAQAAYSITAQETITVTVPATALTGAEAIVATPTFAIAWLGEDELDQAAAPTDASGEAAGAFRSTIEPTGPATYEIRRITATIDGVAVARPAHVFIEAP